MVATYKTFTRWPSRKIFFLAIAIWTLLVLASLLTQRDRIEQTAFSLARTDALANLTKDMAIRKWASNVGGVYIREEYVPPFNSLEEEQRVTVRPSNSPAFRLVKVTPIHLLLAIQQTSNQEFGIQERLTSLQLRNFENMPDDWEIEALNVLNEHGGDMVAEQLPGARGRGHGLMRVMIPMRMEDECLECHRDTLVPTGGLRGGAVIAVNLNDYRTAQEPIWRATQYWHLGIWVLGMIGIFTFQFFARRRAAELLREEEMQRENEAAFSVMAEGAVIAGADGNILWANDAFSRISGFAPDEIIGQPLGRFVFGGEGGGRSPSELMAEQGVWRGEIWSRKKNGERFPEAISMQALRDANGKVRRYISIFSDISERKQNEEQLREYREHLEDLVRQRTEELTIARNQAEAANRSKSAFLANMNHELRTPLNAVIGFSQLMERDASLSAKQQYNAEIISASGRHLLTLINDILELSKIESGKMAVSPEDVSLADLLEEIVAMMRLRAEQQGVELRLELVGVPQAVSVDPAMLRQVLLNLISNAIKFTPGGTVVVRAEGRAGAAGKEEDKIRLAFSVSDTGIGIAVEDRERIFSPFEQAGQADNQSGTGLGLTISREYLQMMGGELRVDSELGKGSVFHFEIVAGAHRDVARKMAEGRVTGLAAGERERHILVIDDIPEARLLVRSLLEPLGLRISEAGSIAEAEKAIAEQRPDLVLLDWFMRDGSGLDLLKRIRSDENLRQPKLIMFTANALDESRREALQAGADDFLSKPFQKEDLFRIVEQQLGLHFIRQAQAADEPVRPGESGEELAAALEALSAPVRENMIQAALSLSATQIAEALRGVAAENPPLALRLGEICASRQFRALWQSLGIMENED